MSDKGQIMNEHNDVQAASTRKLAGDTTQQFLTFTLGQEEFGVDIMMVREVKGWTETTRLPNTPEYVRGVLNLRGIIIPIFDLRARFTGQLTSPDVKHVVIIIALHDRTIGILVDTVSDILTVNCEEIRPAPDVDTSIDHRYVAGLIAVDQRMVVVLDIEKLLSKTLESMELSSAA
jgi:purine-binding chemotaxis protein CheW